MEHSGELHREIETQFMLWSDLIKGYADRRPMLSQWAQEVNRAIALIRPPYRFWQSIEFKIKSPDVDAIADGLADAAVKKMARTEGIEKPRRGTKFYKQHYPDALKQARSEAIEKTRAILGQCIADVEEERDRAERYADSAQACVSTLETLIQQAKQMDAVKLIDIAEDNLTVLQQMIHDYRAAFSTPMKEAIEQLTERVNALTILGSSPEPNTEVTTGGEVTSPLMTEDGFFGLPVEMTEIQSHCFLPFSEARPSPGLELRVGQWVTSRDRDFEGLQGEVTGFTRLWTFDRSEYNIAPQIRWSDGRRENYYTAVSLLTPEDGYLGFRVGQLARVLKCNYSKHIGQCYSIDSIIWVYGEIILRIGESRAASVTHTTTMRFPITALEPVKNDSSVMTQDVNLLSSGNIKKPKGYQLYKPLSGGLSPEQRATLHRYLQNMVKARHSHERWHAAKLQGIYRDESLGVAYMVVGGVADYGDRFIVVAVDVLGRHVDAWISSQAELKEVKAIAAISVYPEQWVDTDVELENKTYYRVTYHYGDSTTTVRWNGDPADDILTFLRVAFGDRAQICEKSQLPVLKVVLDGIIHPTKAANTVHSVVLNFELPMEPTETVEQCPHSEELSRVGEIVSLTPDGVLLMPYSALKELLDSTPDKSIQFHQLRSHYQNLHEILDSHEPGEVIQFDHRLTGEFAYSRLELLHVSLIDSVHDSSLINRVAEARRLSPIKIERHAQARPKFRPGAQVTILEGQHVGQKGIILNAASFTVKASEAGQNQGHFVTYLISLCGTAEHPVEALEQQITPGWWSKRQIQEMIRFRQSADSVEKTTPAFKIGDLIAFLPSAPSIPRGCDRNAIWKIVEQHDDDWVSVALVGDNATAAAQVQHLRQATAEEQSSVVTELQAQPHVCHAVGCEKIIPPNLLMCSPHWRMVPAELRAEVWKHYVQGQEVCKDPSEAYVKAASAAIAAVQDREKGQTEKVSNSEKTSSGEVTNNVQLTLNF